MPNDEGAIVVCNTNATGSNQSYIYDESCTAACAYVCAADHIRVNGECIPACDPSTLPENMVGVEICSNGLTPAQQT